MNIRYTEITDTNHIPECVSFQQRVFNLSDKDALPASYFSMLIRKEHPMGLLVGCYANSESIEKLIGLAVATNDRPVNSLYCLTIGIDPKYQNKNYGYKLALKLKECALRKGYKSIYGLYDPLEANLGKLYSFLNIKATSYIKSPYYLKNNQAAPDKVLFYWDLDDNQHHRIPNSDMENKLINSNPNKSNECFIEIPNNYLQLKSSKPEIALEWRNKTQLLFDDFMNNKGFYINDCRSFRINKSKRTFYFLSKQKSKINE